MQIKQYIPNTITCGNLFCGCIALVQAFNGNLVASAYWVGIACVLDFLDGFAARMLKVSSPVGKDLDSLADMVTFGLVPGVIVYKLMAMSVILSFSSEAIPGPESHLRGNSANDPLLYFAFLIPVFSAIRLAKFNHDTRQSESFIGLPTPANAIFVCSLPLIINEDHAWMIPYILNIKTMLILTVIMSVLMVSELPLIALKFKSFGWKGNEIRYIFIFLSLSLFIAFQFLGIPLTIILYILLSILYSVWKR